MAGTETDVHTYGGDPNLLGRDFHCAGSNSEKYPINLGTVVGSEVKFATTDSNGNIIEDRSSDPLRGCINYNGGKCKIGTKLCPVSSAVSSTEFIQRLLELRKLKAVHSTY